MGGAAPWPSESAITPSMSRMHPASVQNASGQLQRNLLDDGVNRQTQP